MPDTLKSLAGATFKSFDVIAKLHTEIASEDLVLDRYVFLPLARSGIAAALASPFAWGGATRATVDMKVPVLDDRADGGLTAEMTVHVHGPADVTEIDPRQVIRAFPKVDAADAEVDDLVHVEFDRPDFPWLFTPAGPDASGRLVPWITLVVSERRHIAWGEQRGATRRAKIRRDQLQPLGDAWAWAHAQVMGSKPATAESEPTLEQRLSEANAPQNLSRLVCPRHLDDHTNYVACVVPTFLAGAQTGLGLTPTATLAPAWGSAADFAAGDPASMVELPVYYSWNFTTGEDGNFESLARKLKPAVAPPGVGRRRVDATRPWPPLALAADDPGAEIVVEGPVVSPQKPENTPEEHWPSEADQHWDDAVAQELLEKLNNADAHQHAPVPGPSLVGPPLYGSNHARQPRLETEDPAAAAQPQWFRELNTDPRNRIVGGLGARVVQAEQEDLMAAAWNQVVGVEAANRALRLAQLAKHVSASLHRRHLSRLADAAVVSITERVHAKVLDAPERSIWASLEASSLPLSVTVGAFRRLTRVRGPVVRTAVKAAAQRQIAVDALTVRPDRFTTDWVRQYASPDGIGELSELAKSRITDEIAAEVVPGSDRETLLATWDSELAAPAPPDHLNAAELANAVLGPTVDLSRRLLAAMIRRTLATAPSRREMDADPDAAITGAGHGRLLLHLLGELQGEPIEISRSDAERLPLEIGGATERTDVAVSPDAVREFADRAVQVAHRHELDYFPFGDAEASAGRLRELVRGSREISRETLFAGLDSIAGKVITDDPFAEPVRGRIDVPALELIVKLDPKITVPARVHARLTTGSGHMPVWLRPGWFDDLRVEPVMACPRFRYPMYEPLHRYDREWMVPGLGLIKEPDMATLLETNNRFIEAYLVGLNHEMGRELLWREYPTDQRGTYFDSFWTGQTELVADMHELQWRTGALSAHVDAALAGRLVLLVRGDLIRRYPGVVAHAVRQSTDAAGALRYDNGVPLFEASDGQSPVRTLFHVHLPPNVLLVGFDLDRARIDSPGETWWFTLSENPTEPRFGLDPSREGGPTRDNLIWDDFGAAQPGVFLNAGQHMDIGFDGPNSNPPVEHSQWGATSAQVAYLLFQLPARAAFLGKKMVAESTN
jgi:hypothetical protein